MLVAGAYRSDELYPQLPMRDLRARLLGQRLAEEIRLPRLGLAQTATMTSATLGRPVPAQVVAAIHERSDGIPLHVEEFLAAIDEDALTPQSGAAVQAAAVPDTLGDAVLTRAQLLTTLAREVASAAAVIGRSFDFDLLAAVTEAGPDEVAGALRELQDAHLVLPGADAVTFDFRHALIRDALYADTDLPLRRRLHERVARARGGPRLPRRVRLGALRAGGSSPASPTSTRPPPRREAAALSAHGEALELYRRAVRNLPAGLAGAGPGRAVRRAGRRGRRHRRQHGRRRGVPDGARAGHRRRGRARGGRAGAAHGRGRAPARRGPRRPGGAAAGGAGQPGRGGRRGA